MLVVAFTIEINNNNTSCIIEYNLCYTNTIDLKMLTKTVNVYVNFLCKFQKAGGFQPGAFQRDEVQSRRDNFGWMKAWCRHSDTQVGS